MDKFISCTEDRGGNRGAVKNMRTKRSIYRVIARPFMLGLLAATAMAQNPPATGDPYASRGNPKSPDGKYEWVVRTTNPLRYELLSVLDEKVLATINSYYPDANSTNIQYAKAFGVFWNKAGTIVALDELNRRRAGRLYFFILESGAAREMPSEDIFTTPPNAEEGRVVVDPGLGIRNEDPGPASAQNKVRGIFQQIFYV